MSEMRFYGKRILFIGAHPDDIELGCGAFIAQIASQTEVRCVTLSDNQKDPALKNLPDEHFAAMAALGVKPDRVSLLTYETRRFPFFQQEILEEMVKLQREFQ
ncbi:MAG TPA: PIG-L family deacetylase, partial [Flexilinea sp.]|nr:PIG-L family deacetylase [Flexilinea sp.]